MESSKFTALVLGGSFFASAWVLSSGMQSLGQGIAQAGLALASGPGSQPDAESDDLSNPTLGWRRAVPDRAQGQVALFPAFV